jgi:alpha-glucosidase
MALWGAYVLAFAVSSVSATVIPRNSISARDVSSCPGYAASNVQVSDTGLTADLTLAGEPCDAYGEDLKDLILEVTYETGKWSLATSSALQWQKLTFES